MRPKIRCDGESWKILQNEVQLNRLLGAVRWSEATSQPAGSLSRVTVYQTSRTVFFFSQQTSRNNIFQPSFRPANGANDTNESSYQIKN